MENPFRFGTVVDSPYFTDRVEELSRIAEILNSKNHLVVISPRRFGKTSLVRKAVEQSGRKFVFLNMQQVTSIEDLASLLLREILRQHPFERVKHLLKNFRVVPTVSTNPLNDSIEVSFQPAINNFVMLEDTLSLAETACHPYYTQQLSSVVWDLLVYHKTPYDEVVRIAIDKLVRVHDLDFERLWLTFNKTDRKVLQILCKGLSPYELRDMPTSTSFSAIKRLTQDGYVIRTDRYLIEDPIFRHWIEERQT